MLSEYSLIERLNFKHMEGSLQTFPPTKVFFSLNLLSYSKDNINNLNQTSSITQSMDNISILISLAN